MMWVVDKKMSEAKKKTSATNKFHQPLWMRYVSLTSVASKTFYHQFTHRRPENTCKVPSFQKAGEDYVFINAGKYRFPVNNDLRVYKYIAPDIRVTSAKQSTTHK